MAYEDYTDLWGGGPVDESQIRWQAPPSEPQEESEAQKLARFERDYHAPDREAVLAQMRGQPAPSAPQASSPFNREEFRDAWMGTGSDAARQQQLIQQHGLQLDPAGRAQLPTGEVIDLRYGARAGGTQATWTGVPGFEARHGQAPVGRFTPGAALASVAPAAGVGAVARSTASRRSAGGTEGRGGFAMGQPPAAPAYQPYQPQSTTTAAPAAAVYTPPELPPVQAPSPPPPAERQSIESVLTGQPAQNPAMKELYQQLLARSVQGLDVSAEDPAIKASLDAYSVQANRERQNQMAQAAERGGPYATGALEHAARISGENVAIGRGQMAAELMNREVAARRQEIAQALSGMQGVLSTEEQSRLRQIDQALAARQAEVGAGLQETELAQQAWQFGQQMGLSRQELQERSRQFGAGLGLERERLAQQQQQFQTELGERSRQFAAQLGLSQQEIAQRAQQFGETLGFNYEQLAQQGGQFDASLAQRAYEFGQQMGLSQQELAQRAAQFGASLGFSREQLEAANTQQNWENTYRELFG